MSHNLTQAEYEAKKQEIEDLVAEASKALEKATEIADKNQLYFEANIIPELGPLKYSGINAARIRIDRNTGKVIDLKQFLDAKGQVDWAARERKYPDSILVEYSGWCASSMHC